MAHPEPASCRGGDPPVRFFESGVALVTGGGVLIGGLVMLLALRMFNASKGWYEAGARA